VVAVAAAVTGFFLIALLLIIDDSIVPIIRTKQLVLTAHFHIFFIGINFVHYQNKLYDTPSPESFP
jgi:hypothetical protein